jgi:hypothetical protein
MPLPLWLPLLTLAAAMASEEQSPYEQAQPLDKTIYDHIDSEPTYKHFVKELAEVLAESPNPVYEVSARHLMRAGLGDPESYDFAQAGILLHGLARAEPYRPIWVLDTESYEALHNTAPPWELARTRLPRMPFPAMLVRLPEPIPVRTRQVPFPIEVRSILLVEEIPGQKWRYLGFNDAPSLDKVAYTMGWFDLAAGTAKAQLVEGRGPDETDYRMWNEDAIWQLALNLMLALENHHLEGQHIKPRFARGAIGKRQRKKQSPSEYTIVRLSAPTKAAASQGAREATATGRSPQRRHLRAGHWRSFWVSDEKVGDRPIYDSRPRTTRTGEEIEGNLYKVVQWVFPYWAGEGESSPEGRYKVKL